MFFKKKDYEKEYEETLRFLKEQEENIEMIKGFERQHYAYGLDRDEVKINGWYKTIYRFYLEDLKIYSHNLKKFKERDRESTIKRIEADKMIIEEMESFMPLYDEITKKIAYKEKLERKLMEEQIRLISERINASEIKKR